MPNRDHPNHQPDAADHQPSGTSEPTTDQPNPADPSSDEQFALMLDQGPTAPLSVWRRAYHQLGIPWPGHTEIRRRHRLTNTDTAPAITVWQMSWPTPDQHPTNNHTDPHQRRRCDDQPDDTARRLTEALGWEHPPALTTEQQRQLDAERAIAEAHARRYYRPETGQPPAPHSQPQQAAGTAEPDQHETGERDRHDHTHHHHDQHRRDSRDSRIGGSGEPTQPETTGANPDDPTTATPAAELAQRQQVQPIRSADELTQPGMFDTDQELEEFLAELHATRRDTALTALTMTVVQIRNDMAWLTHATRALLHHHRINLHQTCQPEHGATDPSEAIQTQNTAPDQ